MKTCARSCASALMALADHQRQAAVVTVATGSAVSEKLAHNAEVSEAERADAMARVANPKGSSAGGGAAAFRARAASCSRRWSACRG